MHVCESCHTALGCRVAHTMGMGNCGVCGRHMVGKECLCPAANEIATFNVALQGFMLTMRRRFVEHMHKGGWQDIPYGFALKKLCSEAGELAEAIQQGRSRSWHSLVIDEAGDAANFALFIASRARSEWASEESLQKHTAALLEKAEAQRTAKREKAR